MAKRFILKTVALSLGLIFSIALSEGLLRLIDFNPWTYERTDAKEPDIYQPDSLLGWRNKGGNHIVPPYQPSGQPIYMTYLENGQRRTGFHSPHSQGECVIVGGSYTQGWAISDSDTFAWKLQEKYPSLKVLNYGTGGYGSYQCLLLLERKLPRLIFPRFVLYGFIPHHEVRNVASEDWLRLLSSFSRRGDVDVPFAAFDESKGLVWHLPERYLSLPHRESSAVITLIERAYMKIKTRKRHSQKRRVTEKILLQMNRVSRRHGATFIVVLLEANDHEKKYYMNFLNQSNIQFIDCAHDIPDEMKVPGEGHPNGEMNTLWAECISSVLDEQIDGTGLSEKPNRPAVVGR